MLVRDIETVKEYFTNTTVTNIKLLNPFLLTAQEKYILPYMGKPTYELLNRYLDDGKQPDNPAYNAVLPFAQRVVVYFAYRDSTPFRNLLETNAGYAVTMNANMAPASKERTESLKAGVEELGWNSMEQLLAALEENKAAFPDWYNSPISTLAQRNLINNATEFGQYVSLANFSRMAFQSLRTIMDNVENLTIADAIGADTLADIKNKIFTDTVPDDQKQTVDNLKRALANLTMYANIPEPDRNAPSPYAVFNITTESRHGYWLTGMNYLNKAAAALAPAPDPDMPVISPDWQNHPDNKIFVFGG